MNSIDFSPLQSSIVHEALVGTVADRRMLILSGEVNYDTESREGRDSFLLHYLPSIFPFAAESRIVPSHDVASLTAIRSAVEEVDPEILCLLPPLERVRTATPELREHPVWGVGPVQLEPIWIYEALESLSSNAQLLLFMPASLLSARSMAVLRDYVSIHHILRWVIEYETNDIPGVHPAFMWCSLLIETGHAGDSIVKMMKVPRAATQTVEEITKELKRLARQGGGSTKNGYVLRQGLPASAIWGVDANHVKWEEQLADIASLGETVTLGEIATLTRGINLTMLGPALAETGSHYRIFRGRDILPNGELNLEPEDLTVDEVPSRHFQTALLRPGDLVMRGIMASTDGLRVGMMPSPSLLPLVAEQNVIILRLKEGTPKHYQEVLLDYLRSARPYQWLKAQGSIHIDLRNLQALPVPMLDEDVRAALERSVTYQKQLQEWLDELQEARRQLFQLESIRAGRDLLTYNAQLTSQRIQAATAVETLEWKIRTLYPHPLAYRWSRIETLDNPHKRFRAVLEAAEILLAYLAVMGLVLAENQGSREPLGYVQTIRERLVTNPRSGPNFGDWFAIVKEVVEAKRFRGLGPSTPFYELRQSLNDEFFQATSHLKRVRDDVSHLRSIQEDSKLREALHEIEDSLRSAYDCAQFVTQYPLRFLVETTYDTRRDRTKYRYKDLAGDSSLFPTKEARYEGAALQQYALYFATPGRELWLADPWLLRLPCPECGNVETYVFDQLESDYHRVWVKSLERGHRVTTNLDVRDTLEQVGLLPPTESM